MWDLSMNAIAMFDCRRVSTENAGASMNINEGGHDSMGIPGS